MILNLSLWGGCWLFHRQEKTVWTSGSVRRFAPVFINGFVAVLRSRDMISIGSTDMVKYCARFELILHSNVEVEK